MKQSVSIHAPRAGCDFLEPDFWRRRGFSFNPRTPRGVRPRGGHGPPAGAHGFNPRTPRGVRRPDEQCIGRQARVSIHAPRAGCDF